MGCSSVLLSIPYPHPYSTPLLQPTPSPVKAAPQCLPIQSKLKNDNMVRSSAIEKDKLAPKLHQNIRCFQSTANCKLIVSKAPTLATKLAREAYFGDKVLGQCTVMGCRDHPGLPISGLNELKQDLFNKPTVLVQSCGVRGPVDQLCELHRTGLQAVSRCIDRHQL